MVSSPSSDLLFLVCPAMAVVPKRKTSALLLSEDLVLFHFYLLRGIMALLSSLASSSFGSDLYCSLFLGGACQSRSCVFVCHESFYVVIKFIVYGFSFFSDCSILFSIKYFGLCGAHP